MCDAEGQSEVYNMTNVTLIVGRSARKLLGGWRRSRCLAGVRFKTKTRNIFRRPH